MLLLLTATRAFAVTPVQVLYTEPTAGTMPEFGTVPFPNNLYYDGGAPGAGDGTLVNPDPGNPNGGYEAFGLENNVLSLRGERRFDSEVKQENYHRVERAYGAFSRSFTLPSVVDQEKIKAEYKDGVLRVTLPKREEAKPKQISIAVGR